MSEIRQGDVVVVEFPYTDRDLRQVRPAIVVSSKNLGERWPLCWAVMITSAAHEPWPGDVEILDPEAAGLRTACVARTAKIANIELSRVRRIGRLDEGSIARVMAEVTTAITPLPVSG